MGIPIVQEPSRGPVNDWARQPPQAGINPAYRLDHPLTLEGTVNGFYDMAISGSSVNYWVTPPADEVYVLKRMLVVARDADFARADRYGATASLPTGIAIVIEDDVGGLIYDFTPVRIQNVTHWALLAGIDVGATQVGGIGSDPFLMRWTFAKAGANLTLDGRLGHRLKMEIPDNLGVGGAALDQHIVSVQGYRLTTPG